MVPSLPDWGGGLPSEGPHDVDQGKLWGYLAATGCPFLHVCRFSAIVLALWHTAQSACKLASSQEPPLATERIWSTSKGPEDPQRTQAKPSRRRIKLRRFLQSFGRLIFLALPWKGLRLCVGQGMTLRHFPTEQIEDALGISPPEMQLACIYYIRGAKLPYKYY